MEKKWLKILIYLKGICLFSLINMPINISASQNKIIILQDKNENKVYERVEYMASYQGGTDAVFEFISKNIRYPKDALDAQIQGIVICEFIINKDGSFSDVKIKRSIHPALDKEAVRVIKSFPKWTPARNGGETVRVRYTLPVSFRIK